jgi:hypothetical protein
MTIARGLVMRTLLIASTHAQTPQPRTLNPLTPNLETRNPKPEIVNEQIASQADVAGAHESLAHANKIIDNTTGELLKLQVCKRALFSRKRALFSRKGALLSRERALFARKTALFHQ